MKVTQSCPTLCDPVDYTVHEILQASISEWVAFPFSRGSSQPRSNPGLLQADSLPAEQQGKPRNTGVGSVSLLYQIFPTQESSWGLLHCRQILYQLNYQFSSVTQSCPILCDCMENIVHGILQARILEWVACPFSSGSTRPRD